LDAALSLIREQGYHYLKSKDALAVAAVNYWSEITMAYFKTAPYHPHSDIAEAMKRYRIRAPWSAASLALHTQAVLQGACILAKAKGGVSSATASIDYLPRFLKLLSLPAKRKRKEST
jgi:AcrR family transcriptional regulator